MKSRQILREEEKMKYGLFVGLVTSLLVLNTNQVRADPFYADKTIRIIIGYGPGGGYDLYGRLLARHLNRPSLGAASVVVQNMVGAGSLRAANYVYNVAPQDGTVIAAVNQTLPLYALTGGRGVQFDARGLQWLGRIHASNSVLVTTVVSGVSSIDAARKETVTLGGSGAGSDSSMHAHAFNQLLGTRFNVVDGYKGSRDIHMAIERGEVAGRAGITWTSILTSDRHWLTDRKINVLLQIGQRREKELSNVPLFTELTKNDSDRAVAELLGIPIEIGFAHWVGPKVPRAQLQSLRKAYQEAVRDPKLIEETTRLSIPVRHASSEAIEELLNRATSSPKETIDRLAALLNRTK